MGRFGLIGDYEELYTYAPWEINNQVRVAFSQNESFVKLVVDCLIVQHSDAKVMFPMLN